MQYPLGVPPDLRTNIDYVFILRENYINNRKRIYDNFAGIFPTFEAFCTTLDACTQNYECIVIDNTSKSTNLNDVVFWYKAEEHPDNFEICSKEYWQLSREIESSKGDDDDDDDVMYHPSFFRKKNAPRIKVVKKD